MKRLLFLFFILACLFSSALKAQDTVIVMYQKDSAVIPPTDQTVLFFQNSEKLPPATQAKTLLVTKARKTIKLSGFLKSDTMTPYGEHALADLDGDGKKELIIYNFTGGAHCCDEVIIYKNISPNKYQHVARLFGGNTVIRENYEIEFDFYEHFGYFFTCFACAYTDTTDEAPVPVSSIKLRYSKGKMIVVPGDSELKSLINDNLAKICEKPYQKPDPELDQDEGQRKEVALNLVVYYYAFGRNLPETQKLFNKYYKYPDAGNVWTSFTRHLQYLRSGNDF